MDTKITEQEQKPQQKKKTKEDDRSSFFNVGDRVKPKSSEGFATGTVIEIKKGIVVIRPDFRLGESTTCSAKADRWQRAEDDPNGNNVFETPEIISEEPATQQNTLPERVVAEAVAKARWGTLKVTPVDIANDIGTTEQQVNDIVESEHYLTVIRDFFQNYKSWQTWAKKPNTTITKMADRLWLSEEKVSEIVVDIVE